MSRPRIHPRQALFESHERGTSLPVCDHYAGVEARMRKSLQIQADMADQPLFDVTLDLEDGAPIGGEHEHALLVADLIGSRANRFNRVGARVHPLHHPRFADDVHALLRFAGHRIAYLMVPKVSSARQLQIAVDLVERARREHGVSRPVPVHALIETHGALQDVTRIAANPAIESLSFGLMDFVSSHRGAIPAAGMTAQGQFTHPLVLRAKLDIAAACHAACKTPSHCVVTEFSDTRAISHAATRASRELGYLRMWSIHPNQIQPIVDAFAPVVAEIDTAVEVLMAGQEASWAPIALRGTLHDRASYRYYWHVLERAWRTGQPLPAQARLAFFEESSE